MRETYVGSDGRVKCAAAVSRKFCNGSYACAQHEIPVQNLFASGGFRIAVGHTGDGRGVLVEPTSAGRDEVRRQRRRLTRLAERALRDLGPAETARVTAALVELRVLLDRR
mgnify:CR=1 FL=1